MQSEAGGGEREEELLVSPEPVFLISLPSPAGKKTVGSAQTSIIDVNPSSAYSHFPGADRRAEQWRGVWSSAASVRT